MIHTPLHLFVLPVTGANAGKQRICYVCQYGSAPFIAAFIRPDSERRAEFIADVQRVKDSRPGLEAIAILLTTPSDAVTRELNSMAVEQHLTIPLAVLDPELKLNGLPVSMHEELTVLIFRGRQIVRKLETAKAAGTFFDAFARDATATFKKLAGGGMPGVGNGLLAFKAKAQPGRAEMVSELDSAAAEVLAHP